MRIAVLGPGAVGSYLACMMGRRDHAVTVLARGERAAAIRAHGIRMQRKDGEALQVRPAVAEGPEGLGAPDVAFICVKAYSVPALVPALAALSRAGSEIVFVQNGIPWWYLAEPAGDGGSALDPGGAIAAAVAADRVIGCVTYVNVRNAGPGLADHAGDDTFALGRPDGRLDAALERIVAAMVDAGIAARAGDQIRRDIWVKLWGNLAFNPISALTGATMDKIIAEPDTRPLVMAMMREAQALAAAGGIAFPLTIDQRLEVASRAGAFKTSMLQDLEAGRQLEIDAIIGAVSEYGRRVGVPTPSVDIVLGLVRQKARELGLAG
ncbi:MAG: 2-dehydropantoate 2-reductase [Alphaproteobacteria bacterium]|nr:2-dehydropantoate 2-reductase [Alphaproteobacteria bacterium]